MNILKAPKQNIPTLTYGSPTTNDYIHLAQILKRATDKPQVILPQLPAKQIASEPRVVTHMIRQAVTENRKAVPPPRVAKKTIKQHPFVSNRHIHLSKLRLTKSRINRLVRQAV